MGLVVFWASVAACPFLLLAATRRWGWRGYLVASGAWLVLVTVLGGVAGPDDASKGVLCTHWGVLPAGLVYVLGLGAALAAIRWWGASAQHQVIAMLLAALPIGWIGVYVLLRTVVTWGGCDTL